MAPGCGVLLEALRKSAREQGEIVERVVASGGTSEDGEPESLGRLGEEYEAISRKAREALNRHRSELSVVDAVASRGGGGARRALQEEVDACDETILSLIREAKSALDSIDTVSE